MDHWRGKWALITGASAGIGQALAEQLAEAGAHLILTARRSERLEVLAEKLTRQYGVRIKIFPADLTRPAAPDDVFAFTEKQRLEVDLLVLNAGFGTYGPFSTSDRTRQLAMVQVNVAAVVALTHLYLPGMIDRRHGEVLIVSSTAAFQGLPYFATYAATKAFDLLFAEALAEEVRGYGLRVCALCPGRTVTEFQKVAGGPRRHKQQAKSAAEVARVGLQALAHGRSYTISGVVNYLHTHAQRFVPRRLVTGMAAKNLRPPA
ncbi:SDR family oxidoreductase [Nitrospira sp. KM1]|uniref:SDR family NAD(P)-dependent oxidoreductase n=1 Tax=Nitrospira sp. KM1 TaxID=1936990 RepID=UPI001563841D|nr:SDR family oxidoreductase [Nitrospira sp. KM1]